MGQSTAIGTDGLIGMVITDNEDNIGPFLVFIFLLGLYFGNAERPQHYEYQYDLKRILHVILFKLIDDFCWLISYTMRIDLNGLPFFE